MAETDPNLRPEIIIEAPFEHTDQIGRSALYGTLIEDLFSDLYSSYELMDSIQHEVPNIEIKEEQLACLDAIQEARVRGIERGLVQMATGLGKTTVVAADVKRFLYENPEARVLFLCHQNDILAQAKQRFKDIVGPDYTYGDFTGESQDYHAVTCLFASFQAMRGWREAFLEDEFDYIVVDESHHATAPTYQPTLEYFKPGFLLGVTATPDRLDLKDIRSIFGEEIFNLPLEEAIADGLLAEVDYRVITDDIEDDHVLKTDTGKKLSIRQLNRSIFVPKRDEEIARIIQEHSEKIERPKRIIFCNSIEHAEEFAQYFDSAAPLHTRMPHWEQDKYIEDFKAGRLDTILAVNMFNEGIDVPDANQIVFLRATQSKTIFLQQLGRGLRKIAGKENVQVLDFVANCERLTMLDEVWQDVRAFQDERESLETPDLLRVEVGSIQFNEVARRVLEILDEIQANRQIYKNWSKDDSTSYYRKLSQDLGYPAKVSDIKKAHEDPDIKGPPFSVLTKDFDLRLKPLQEACGIQTRKVHKDWTASETIAVYNELSQGQQIGITELRSILKRRQDLPGLSVFLKPFEGRLTNLHLAVGQQPNRPEFAEGYIRPGKRSAPDQFKDWTMEDSLRVYHEVSAGQRLGRTALLHILQKRDDVPGIMRFLRPFKGNFSALEIALGHEPANTKWDEWSEVKGLEVYAELTQDGPLTARQLAAALKERPHLPSVNIFLSPFEGSISTLNERMKTDPTIVERWDRVQLELKTAKGVGKHGNRWKDWTEANSIETYRRLSGEAALGSTALERMLREDHPELPSIRTILSPFEGDFSKLVTASGYEASKRSTTNERKIELSAEEALSIYRELSGGVPLKARDLEKILKERHDLPSIKFLLLPFEGKINQINIAAGYM